MCRQLFTGHVMGSRPIERKKTTRRMIIAIIVKMAPSKFNVLVVKTKGNNSSSFSRMLCIIILVHSRPQGPRSFWSAPRIATSARSNDIPFLNGFVNTID